MEIKLLIVDDDKNIIDDFIKTIQRIERDTDIKYKTYTANTLDEALEKFVHHLSIFNDKIGNMVSLINLYKKPLNKKVLKFYNDLRLKNIGQNPLKIIEQTMKDKNISFEELINYKNQEYEKI